MRKGWALASLTSPIGGSAHDGCDPGKLAVGDAENSLELFKVDGESFGEGVREPHWDGGSEHHCPAPATIRGHIAQVRGERRRHGHRRAWSTSWVPASCRAKQMCVLQNVHIVPQLWNHLDPLVKPFPIYSKLYGTNVSQSKPPFLSYSPSQPFHLRFKHFLRSLPQLPGWGQTPHSTAAQLSPHCWLLWVFFLQLLSLSLLGRGEMPPLCCF